MRRANPRAGRACCDLFRPNKTIHDPGVEKSQGNPQEKSGGRHASVSAAALPTNHNQPEMPAKPGQKFRLCASGTVSRFAPLERKRPQPDAHAWEVKQRECHGGSGGFVAGLKPDEMNGRGDRIRIGLPLRRCGTNWPGDSGQRTKAQACVQISPPPSGREMAWSVHLWAGWVYQRAPRSATVAVAIPAATQKPTATQS
jgi:hypothetical protein